MSVRSVDLDMFLDMAGTIPVIDVRSPAEYEHAHIPLAHNIPLFNDDERALVGTLYKQSGKKEAVLKGLEFFAPRMKDIIFKAKEIALKFDNSEKESLLVHCWRGGMRSAGVAWLLDLYGFRVFTLAGGYKSFRRWVIESFSQPLDLMILGGYTGSRKTDILNSLKSKYRRHVIDLEGLASHRGSAFGSYGMGRQPTQEMFENLLATELEKQKRLIKRRQGGSDDKSEKDLRIWIEDESQRIGSVNIPQGFWAQMRVQPVIFIETPFEERLENICRDYGGIEKDLLVGSITRIRKRLGGLDCKNAIGRVIEDDIKGCFEILLRYYDKHYEKSLSNRPSEMKNVSRISIRDKKPELAAEELLKYES
jgi:tRNA 2-selenouridine synthase